MFVSGILGFLLDNTVPGTLEERGILKWRAQFADDPEDSKKSANTCYDLPFGMGILRRQKWAQYVPFLPTFKGFPAIIPMQKMSKIFSRKKVSPKTTEASTSKS